MDGRYCDIPDEIYIKHYSSLQRIAKDHMSKPADLPSGVKMRWIYGKTGTGKSFYARLNWPVSYLKSAQNKWWCGYQGEDNVIIDDLDKSHTYQAYNLKIWMDRYAFIAETKGGAICIRPQMIIVTSNYHPREIWSNPSDLDPILRRCKVMHMLSITDQIFHYDDEEIIDAVDHTFTIGEPVTEPIPLPAGVLTASYAPGFRSPAYLENLNDINIQP